MRNSSTGGPDDSGRKPVVAALVRSADVEMSLYQALAGNAEAELRARHVADFDLSDLLALRGDVAIVDIDTGSAQEVALLTDFVEQRRAMPVIVTSPFLDVQSMCTLMRIGVRHIMPQPIEREPLVDAVQHVLSQRRAAVEPASGTKGSVVSVLGSCGGVGATTFAVQAASVSAQRKPDRSTCLLDLDIQFGGAALQLEVTPRGSIIDLIQEPERFDGSMLRGAMAQPARSNFDLLAAPANFYPVEPVEPERIAAVIETAAGEYRLTLIDLPLLWSHWTHAALRSSHALVLVVQPTVPALRQGRRQLDMLRQEELDDIPLTVVLNRVERGLFGAAGVTLGEAETALNRKIDHVIPESPAFKASAQSGQPLGKMRGGRPLEKKIAAVLDAIVQEDRPASAPARRPFGLPFLRGSFTPAIALGR